MKTKTLLLFFFILVNCSTFNETLKGNLISYKEVSILDFNTAFPVINIEVNQNEYDEMFTNYKKEI